MAEATHLTGNVLSGTGWWATVPVEDRKQLVLRAPRQRHEAPFFSVSAASSAGAAPLLLYVLFPSPSSSMSSTGLRTPRGVSRGVPTGSSWRGLDSQVECTPEQSFYKLHNFTRYAKGEAR